METNTNLEQSTGMSYDQIIKIFSMINLNDREIRVYNSIVDAFDKIKELTPSEQERVMQRVFCYLIANQSK